MSKFLILAVCLYAVVAQPGGHIAKRAIGESVSFSSSSAGSGGFGGESWRFPTSMPFGLRSGMHPGYGLTNSFQRFLDTANAAHIHANQDPVFAKVYKQQMAILATLQQMAQTQYPFAFPGFELPNRVETEVSTWNNGPVISEFASTGVPKVMTTVIPNTDSAVYTSGAVSYGSPGGFGVASSFPGGADGLGVRIAEEFPAPVGGGRIGTFSSSSSGVSSVNGQTTSYKTSTIGVNDNGRITFRTITD